MRFGLIIIRAKGRAFATASEIFPSTQKKKTTLGERIIFIAEHFGYRRPSEH